MASSAHQTENNIIDREQLYQIALQRYHVQTPGKEPASSTPPLSGFDRDFLEIIVETFSNTACFPKNELHQFSIPTIIDYLEKTHRLYLNKRLPEIGQTLHILGKNYDKSHPCLSLLHLFFMDYQEHLTEHIHQEENTLFPYIKSLLEARQQGLSLQLIFCRIGQYSLQDFFHEHTDTEQDLQKVRKAIQAYEPGRANQSPYRILLTQLKTFEMDLHLHARIEEEVLIPKVMELEKEVKAQFIIKSLKN